MRAVINNSLVLKLKPHDKYYDVWDERVKGFQLRVSPTGRKTYRCVYKRGKVKTLGTVDRLTPSQARDYAKQILAKASMGVDFSAKSEQARSMSFEEYISKEYAPWRLANCKSGAKDLERLRINFFSLLGKRKLADIDLRLIEKWRTNRLVKNNNVPSTVNRHLNVLRASLSKAVEWGFLKEHPLKNLKPLKVDASAKVRYLSLDELSRLKNILHARKYDYLNPMILISLNTGMRRGELFSLRWENIDFDKEIITLDGVKTKSGRTRHLPLNNEALNALKEWSSLTPIKAGLVFVNKLGEQFGSVKKAWKSLLLAADIENFRWHDMRHHFASWLVMSCVDLNTVRELLGHSRIEMTLRYAHLAPEHKVQAVSKLPA